MTNKPLSKRRSWTKDCQFRELFFPVHQRSRNTDSKRLVFPVENRWGVEANGTTRHHYWWQLSGPKESCEKAGEPTITIINAVSRLESDGKEREIVPPQRESENEWEREGGKRAHVKLYKLMTFARWQRLLVGWGGLYGPRPTAIGPLVSSPSLHLSLFCWHAPLARARRRFQLDKLRSCASPWRHGCQPVWRPQKPVERAWPRKRDREPSSISIAFWPRAIFVVGVCVARCADVFRVTAARFADAFLIARRKEFGAKP